MSIYSKRQRWKVVLAFGALLIISVSFWYSNRIVRNIASNERKNVELWVDAIRKRAELVKYTEALFNRLRDEDRKKTEIWAMATQNMTSTDDNDARSFYLNVVTSNKTIPALIVDAKGNINSPFNIDEDELPADRKFKGDIKKRFSQYPPIVVDDGFNNFYYIYYENSSIFKELQLVMNDLIRSFLNDVVSNSASVPVIITDSTKTKIIASGNLDKEVQSDTAKMLTMVKSLDATANKMSVALADIGQCNIYYQDSFLLTQLRYFPIVQFSVIAMFIIIAYSIFSISYRAEQNQVWVGMSKETAHQLGTPLSALMAWMEMLRLQGVNEETLREMSKDIKRLETVTERFSKIGSMPVLELHKIWPVMEEAIEYMRSRVSSKIKLSLQVQESALKDSKANINVPLFEWVIENLFRNAVDAMEGDGLIELSLGEKGEYLTIDFTDTGKGIPKSKLKTVFQPGFTSKKRGWGLGLSLSKRIIENYHKGKIFVKRSEPGKGTTFRIMLLKVKA